MIHQSERDELLKQIRKGDYEAATKIYQNNTMRYINRRYLQRFLEGKNNPTGHRPTAHQPLQMYRAIVQAIANRQQREAEATEQAAQIRNTTLTEQIRQDLDAMLPRAICY